ncbi:MAG: hypothetical protein ACHQSE_02775 [Gemmatimonadales bacterium]
MPSPFARWRVRHLVASWVGYWVVLAAVTLAPAAVAIWKVSREGAKGNANVSLGNGVLHANVTVAGSTTWELTVAMTTLALMLAGPPLLLWVWWLLSASASRHATAQRPPAELGSGGELPLRHDDRARDAIHR